MQIADQKVVVLNFTLRDQSGEVVDSSEGQAPLSYIHGVNQMLPGLESELAGKAAGDAFKVQVEPEGAYGPRDDSLTMDVPKEQFEQFEGLTVGQQIQADDGEQLRIVTVTSIGDKEITLDLNHPLAGQTLDFDIKIVEVRDATESELDHGHPHSEGECGCGHDH